MKVYTFASPRPQNFSIPLPIIRSMTVYPTSPKGFQKLLKSCKYFFLKNKIVCVDQLGYSDREKEWYSFEYFEWTSHDLNKRSYKFWPYKDLLLVSMKLSSLASILAPKIYLCSITKLSIIYQELTYDEFILFTSSETITNFLCDFTQIKHKNGTAVRFTEIFRHLRNVEKCQLDLWYIKETLTIDELISVIKNLKFLKSLDLKYLIESIDFNAIADLIKEYESVWFSFSFTGTLSHDYKQILHKFINECLERKLKKIPYISYTGQDEITYQKMQNLYKPDQ